MSEQRDYIEREALGTILNKAIYNSCGGAKMAGIRYARDMLATIPPADVRPVVRGKWTRINYEPCGHDYKCSACGWLNDLATPFCPNCGAEM